ncbi:phosphoribosylpyrophosphate synthetase [Mucilaginibacter flavidus]|uniref:phosphoribosylpyrophosphate synthetase n=1 Tax=Mucilaginibacter flavidus TaxID=2949309 RepID=UPI0020934E3F|nr:phosphoribosylpyrophosphate synthetase [Mucilaginibacter flavidus]MCO5948574.1 phosphoribosylpyrophosphate synthetase [Mucilaginibacter flavidus]
MTTVSEVLNYLEKEGYTIDFNLKDSCLECHGNYIKLYPEEFVIDQHYRFEGISDPEDEAVAYAISSLKHNLKGVLVNGYGISSDPHTEDIVRALQQKHL